VSRAIPRGVNNEVLALFGRQVPPSSSPFIDWQFWQVHLVDWPFGAEACLSKLLLLVGLPSAGTGEDSPSRDMSVPATLLRRTTTGVLGLFD